MNDGEIFLFKGLVFAFSVVGVLAILFLVWFACHSFITRKRR